MGQGQGSISNHERKIPAGAPFAAGSANNGLSVDAISGAIVLGDDVGGILSTLLSDRFIPLGGFDIILTQDGIGLKALSTINNLDNIFAGLQVINNSAGIAAQGAVFLENDVGARLEVFLNGSGFVFAPGRSEIHPTNGLIAIGDTPLIGNGTIISIDDTASAIRIDSNTGDTHIGDIFGAGNNSSLLVNDFAQLIQVASGGFLFLLLDVLAGLYGIGDLNVSLNGTALFVDDVNQRVSINAANGLLIAGDPTLIHTGTILADGAGVAAGTLLNAPAAGNPTKWIGIDDNGTTRFVPAW